MDIDMIEADESWLDAQLDIKIEEWWDTLGENHE